MGQMDARTLADVHEDDLLAEIFPALPTRPEVRLGVGDDTALLAVPTGAVLVTTDSMVLGRDFLDEWSDGVDVGRKLVTQNLADVAAMGGYPTAVVVSLMAGHDTTVQWCKDFNSGVARSCSESDVAVVGGDLSSAPRGSRVVSITAMGELAGPMVLRSGARPGDLVAVSDRLGRSDAGLRLLQQGRPGAAPELVAFHRRPVCRVAAGPEAAAAGATAMMDISDGLVRDARRIAASSGVRIELCRRLLAPFAAELEAAVGDDAWACVVSGGEEHTLLACFPTSEHVPEGWTVVGEAGQGTGVALDGDELGNGGWDHFGA
jgi:thiamine-monophosphate kinase